MRKRIITAVIGLGIMIPILVFGGVVGAAVLFALAAGFSVYEMLECCGMQKRASILVPAVLLSAFAVMFTYIPFLRFQTERAYLCAALVITVLLVLFFFWLLWVCVLTPQKSDIEKVLMFFAMFLYITVGFCSLAALRGVGLFRRARRYTVRCACAGILQLLRYRFSAQQKGADYACGRGCAHRCKPVRRSFRLAYQA